MFNKYPCLKIVAICIIVAFVLAGLFFDPHPAKAQVSADNGFAIGAYTGQGSLSDLKYYFYNTGFSSSGSYPEQIVLSASLDGVMYQTAIYILNSQVIMDNEWWDISGDPCQITKQTHTLTSAILNSWHTLELRFFTDGGTTYVGDYLDGVRYDSWVGYTGTFDSDVAPSIVIESLDTTYNDWTSARVYGNFQTWSTNLPSQFYGGCWGAINAGTTIGWQTSDVYVGENTQAPDNVAVTGYYLGWDTQGIVAIGGISEVPVLTHSLASTEWSTYSGNVANTHIS